MKIDIDKRTFEFGIRIIKLVAALPRTTAGRTVGNQIIRSGTSVGANVEEALGGHTKIDFAHSMNIAKKEARETRFWLRLIIGTELLPIKKVELLLKECEELVAILTIIVKNSNDRKVITYK